MSEGLKLLGIFWQSSLWAECARNCREAGAGLVEMFIPRANREIVQHALNRGNALMVTSVEIGFAFGAESTVSATCQAILSAATLWNSLTRLASYQLQFKCLLQSALSTQACEALSLSRRTNLPVRKSCE